jgi:hypothetical protein
VESIVTPAIIIRARSLFLSQDKNSPKYLFSGNLIICFLFQKAYFPERTRLEVRYALVISDIRAEGLFFNPNRCHFGWKYERLTSFRDQGILILL